MARKSSNGGPVKRPGRVNEKQIRTVAERLIEEKARGQGGGLYVVDVPGIEKGVLCKFHELPEKVFNALKDAVRAGIPLPAVAAPA